ncbi:MAG: hypothetical protein WDM71_06140 [Ferruginibacter sp.]
MAAMRGTYNYDTVSAPTTTVTPVSTGTPTSSSSTPVNMCFGTSAVITAGRGSNATSWDVLDSSVQAVLR